MARFRRMLMLMLQLLMFVPTEAQLDIGSRRLNFSWNGQAPECLPGFVDTTGGNAYYLVCGSNCTGGPFWTSKVCDCACVNYAANVSAGLASTKVLTTQQVTTKGPNQPWQAAASTTVDLATAPEDSKESGFTKLHGVVLGVSLAVFLIFAGLLALAVWRIKKVYAGLTAVAMRISVIRSSIRSSVRKSVVGPYGMSRSSFFRSYNSKVHPEKVKPCVSPQASPCPSPRSDHRDQKLHQPVKQTALGHPLTVPESIQTSVELRPSPRSGNQMEPLQTKHNKLLLQPASNAAQTTSPHASPRASPHASPRPHHPKKPGKLQLQPSEACAQSRSPRPSPRRDQGLTVEPV